MADAGVSEEDPSSFPLVVIVRILGHCIAEIDHVCYHERIISIDDSCPVSSFDDGIGCHCSFDDYEGDLYGEESLLQSVGRRGDIKMPCHNRRWSVLPFVAAIVGFCHV